MNSRATRDRPRKKHECGANASGLCACASVPVFRVFVARVRESCAGISLVINVNEISARVLPLADEVFGPSP